MDSFFANSLSKEARNALHTSFASGLLIIRRNYGDTVRFFAISFGYGKSLLLPGVIESRFGLKTALNTLNPEHLRSIVTNSLEAVPTNERIQSSKLSKLEVFDVNIQRDILRSITASTADEYTDDFGKMLTGSDSLHLGKEIDVDSSMMSRG